MTQRHSRTCEIVQNQYGAKLPLMAKNIILAADTDHRLHRQNVIKIMNQIKVMKPITKTQQIIYISPIDIKIDVEPSGQEDWNIPDSEGQSLMDIYVLDYHGAEFNHFSN
jgi:hypothetical protein